MLKNYFIIAIRNISRQKLYATINVLGLSMGLTCCLFIFLWVSDEKAIDNFHGNGRNLYAVYQTTTADGKTDGSYSTPLRVITGENAPAFLMEGIEKSVPVIKSQVYYATGYELPWGHAETFQVGEKKIKLEGSRAGKDFFKLFNFPLIEGNPVSALAEMKGIAISRKMAELFFGTARNAMGKSIRYENSLDFIITAVFENLNPESSMHFDFLFNWEAQKKLLAWASNDFQSYVELDPNAKATQAEYQINQYLQPRLDNNPSVKIHIGLQHFGDKYLHSNFINGKPETGRIEYVRIFSGVAIFILIIACINFMNLSTAQSVKRAKEVGLRKVVGSTRAQLVGQFFGESMVYSFLAMCLSIIIFIILLPAFNQFTGKEIAPPFGSPGFWVVLASLTLLTSIVSGSYPALYLSSLRPVNILKGVLGFSRSSTWFRKGLTIFQFALSILLLVATIVITGQINYVQNTDLGYSRENLIYTRIEGELAKKEKYNLFKNQLFGMPGIAMVDRSSEAPHAMDFVVTDAVNWEGKNKFTNIGFKPASVGFDFVKIMNLKMAAGRDFSPAVATDSADAFLINEEAAKEMGLKQPLGKWVSAWQKKGHIIGILKDYHTHSLREPIKPIVLDVKEYENFGVIIARALPGKTREALGSLTKVYRSINPNYPFAYQFVDEEYKNLYSNELIISKLSVLFASLAILISSLGLLGLVMFSAEQRTKEIGIRKVLGASSRAIFLLFSNEFIKLICIAFVIAVPIAWYLMHGWLQDFAYRMNLSWWIFAAAGSASFLIAFITVSFQSIKAAVANPIKSLRTE